MSGCSDLQCPQGTATPARDLRRWEHSLMSWPSRFPCSLYAISAPLIESFAMGSFSSAC